MVAKLKPLPPAVAPPEQNVVAELPVEALLPGHVPETPAGVGDQEGQVASPQRELVQEGETENEGFITAIRPSVGVTPVGPSNDSPRHRLQSTGGGTGATPPARDRRVFSPSGLLGTRASQGSIRSRSSSPESPLHKPAHGSQRRRLGEDDVATGTPVQGGRRMFSFRRASNASADHGGATPESALRCRSPVSRRSSRRSSNASFLSSESAEGPPDGVGRLKRKTSSFGFGSLTLAGLGRGRLPRSATTGNLALADKKKKDEEEEQDSALLDAKTLDEALQITYKMSVLLPGGHLHRRIKLMERAMARESTVNILRSSRPLVCALSKRWFQSMLLLYCFGHFVISISAVMRAAGSNLSTFSQYRFTALEQRDGSLPVTAHVAGLGLLRDGCKVEAEAVEYRAEGAEVVVGFGAPVAMNGFFFVTAPDPPASDPVRFLLQGRNPGEEGGGAWTVVGSSGFRVQASGEAVQTAAERFDTPTGRGATVKMETTAPWPWYVGWGAAPLCVAVFVLVAGLLGMAELEKRGERTFQLGWLVGASVRLIATVGYMARGEWREAVYWVLSTAGAVAILGASFSSGRWFVRLLVAVGVYLALLEVFALEWFPGRSSWEHAVPFLGIAMVLVGLSFKLLRLSIKWGARVHIQDDKRAFEKAWAELEAQDNAKFDLYRLEKCIQDQNKKLPYRLARQYNTLDENVDREGLKRGSLAKTKSARSLTEVTPHAGDGPMGGLRKAASEVQLKKSASVRGFFGLIKQPQRGRLLDFRNPVRSLDQLYTEGYGTNIMLRAKAQEWALASEGMFSVGLGAGDAYTARGARFLYAKWSDIRKSPDMMGRVQWTKLKQVDRAIEKAMLCYNCDVSRLLDISRQRIVFDRIQDLSACFDRIAADSDIALCRIKNLMGSGYRHKSGAGFRAVIINLRICTRAAVDLGLDTHVCELQLVLSKMVQLQTREQHANYIRFRNDLRKSEVREPLWHVITKCLTWSWIKTHLPFHRYHASHVASTLAKRKANLAQVTPTHQHNPLLVDRSDSFLIRKDAAAGLSEVRRKLHDQMMPAYKINSNTAGDELHNQISVVNDAMQHANRIGVAFTSKAAAAMLSKRMWQAALFVVAALALVWSVRNAVRAYEPSYLAFQHLRFTALEQRDGSLPVTAHVAGLGLLRDGCKVEAEAVEYRAEGAEVVVGFGAPVAMNGFFFVTAPDPPASDPVRFLLQGRNPGGGWEVVGSSSWRVRATAAVRFTQGRFPTPTGRNQRVDVHPRAEWPWVVAFPGVQLVVLLVAFTLVACGASGRARHAEWLLMAGFTAVTILQVVGGAGEIARGRMEDGVYWLLFAAAPLAMGVMIAVDEKHIIARMTAAGLYLCVLELVFAAAVWRDLTELTNSPPLTGMLFFLAGATLLGAHAMAMWRAKRLIQEDKAKYDAVWAREMADKQTNEAVSRFAERVREVTKKLGEGWARQMELKQAESLSVSLLARYDKAYAQNADGRYIAWSPHLSRQKARRSFKIKKRFTFMRALTGRSPNALGMGECPSVFVDVATRIESLDQLYMQAHCMDVVLRAKVQQWALGSDGMFPLVRHNGKACTMPTFQKWSELKELTNPPVKWAKVKSVSRSIEKLLRVYQADVSKLVDVCRQSIVFGSVADLARCFDLVISDPEVDLLRVVNRLDTDYDATVSAGYRDVKLNIRINTTEAVELYINSHVCELQLIHQDFARLKHDAGHQRYKLFRDERCE